MLAAPLLTVEINPGPTPVAVVIWLHGLGADGHDFEPIVPQLRLPPELPIRFVFPHAPEIAVTAFGVTTAANYALSGFVDWPLVGLFIAGGLAGGVFGRERGAGRRATGRGRFNRLVRPDAGQRIHRRCRR